MAVDRSGQPYEPGEDRRGRVAVSSPAGRPLSRLRAVVPGRDAATGGSGGQAQKVRTDLATQGEVFRQMAM